MVRERRTSVPGEGHSSGELAGVERGGRSGYQFAGGRIRPQGQEQFQQISEHQGGYQSGGRSGYQSGRRGEHTGGRGGRGPPAPQAQRYYAGPEFQQKGGNHQQYPRGGATPQPGPSRPRSSDLHQATMLPYQVAPNNSKLPFWSPRESVGDDSSSSHATQQHPVGDATPQPRGGRPPFVGPSRLQYPDLHQAISPYQPPYRSAPSTSKAPFGSPTKYLGDDTSSQAPQQHPRGDAKPQPRGGEPPYGGSTSLSPDLHQAISPYQPTNLPAPTTSKKMVNGGIVNHWICVNFASRVNECTAFGFCQELAKICSNSGMAFEHKPVMLPITAYSNEVESVLKAIFEYAMTRLQGKELDLLIVILPDKNGSIYGDLKRICETDLGLVFQCCLAKHVLKDREKQYQYLVNLSLKINAKVGGRNTVLADAPCIEGEGEEGHVFLLKH